MPAPPPRPRLDLALSARAAGSACACRSTCCAPEVDETPLRRRGAGRARRSAWRWPRPTRSPTRDRDAVVIGSDQVADLDGVAIGKPGDHARATAQLRAMSGRSVVFQTAVAVVLRRDRLSRGASAVPVTVRFRDAERRRDRALPARRAALRLRRQRQVRDARHRAARGDRVRRPDRADRPAADPHLRAAARRRHRPAARANASSGSPP